MIEGLKPYSTYKESGVSWLGLIPQSWGVNRTKWIFRRAKELNVGRQNKNVLSLTLRGVVNNDPESPEGMVPKDYATYQLFRKNDLVFKLIDLENIQTSRVGLVHEDGIMSSAYVRLIPPIGTNVLFFYFQFFDLYKRGVFNSLGAGVRSTLTPTDLGNIRILIPSPEDQTAIVRFLSHANQKIDNLILAKKKQLELLNEQKQVILFNAVTHGLNPNVQLKPSEVPWLDGIPNHWSMQSNRNLFQKRKKIVGSQHREYKVLSLTKRGVIVRNMEAGGKFSTFWERSQEVRPGDLVFCFFDVDETPRTVGISHDLGMISPDYTVMECQDKLTASFLELFYIAMDDRKMLRPLYTGLRKRISKPLFRAAKTPIPPSEEILAIIAYLKEAVVGIDKSAEAIQKEISLMQEYRTRLTSDIVTGKLDVREAAAKLPELTLEEPAELYEDEIIEDLETDEVLNE